MRETPEPDAGKPETTDTQEPITGSSGAATGAVVRLRRGDRTMVVKSFRPVTSGRHVEAARDPRHFAYWRREPLAYASGLLPSGPFRAPRCYAVTDEAVYLEDVQGKPESPEVAARRLARGQGQTAIPDVPWLAGH
ncbi:MAG: aminoglycoside phosphotransferase family protein, partial [Nonomuraea sp.]|nr:aminoglycoside phosphotransferase family protein [Nonomuraea sp.]